MDDEPKGNPGQSKGTTKGGRFNLVGDKSTGTVVRVEP